MSSLHAAQQPAAPPIRPIAYGTPDIAWEREPDGGFRMRSRTPLAPYEPSLARLFWAAVEAAPARVFLTERDETGQWRKLTYEEARATVDASPQRCSHAGLRPSTR